MVGHECEYACDRRAGCAASRDDDVQLPCMRAAGDTGNLLIGSPASVWQDKFLDLMTKYKRVRGVGLG